MTLPDRLLACATNWERDGSAPITAALLREAAAALSGREAVAMVSRGRTRGHLCWLGNNEAKWPHGTFLYTTPPPGDVVVVPRWLLEQVYGMAREGCEAPLAGYRWCERIDSIMHGAEPESEYAEWARPLPASFPAAPSAKGV